MCNVIYSLVCSKICICVYIVEMRVKFQMSDNIKSTINKIIDVLVRLYALYRSITINVLYSYRFLEKRELKVSAVYSIHIQTR